MAVALLGNASILWAAEDYSDSKILPGLDEAYYLKGRIDVLNKAQGKFLLHLEGTHYEMGLQHGYLLAPYIHAAAGQAIDPIIAFVLQGIPPFLYNLGLVPSHAQIKNMLLTSADSIKRFIPQKYLDEMQGIVDGVHRAGEITTTAEKENLYREIVILNIGPDIALAMYNNYSLNPDVFSSIYLDENGNPLELHDGANYVESLAHMCDAFVVTGSATTTQNKTIMGRNFMYTDTPWWKYGIITEYYPEVPGEIRHMGVGMAGVVGIISGMNIKGLGIGTNLTTTGDNAQGLIFGLGLRKIGMGAGIAARKTLAENADLSGAIQAIKDTQLGATWLFTIADGKGEIGAAAVAKGANGIPTVRHINEPDPQYLADHYPELGYTAPLDDEEGHVNQENSYNLLVTSNFFMKSEMYQGPVLVYGNARYNKLLSLLETAIDNGGVCFDNDELSPDPNKAGCLNHRERHGEYLVNYLRYWEDNPGNYPMGDDRYDQNYPVREIMKTSLTLFDLTTTRLKTKYSKYDHDWVFYNLADE